MTIGIVKMIIISIVISLCTMGLLAQEKEKETNKKFPIPQDARNEIMSIQKDINNLVLRMQNVILQNQIRLKLGDEYEFDYSLLEYKKKEERKDKNNE